MLVVALSATGQTVGQSDTSAAKRQSTKTVDAEGTAA
jgi:hypothetical protein